MPFKIIVIPTRQPLSRNQAKAQLRITEDETAEDEFIDDLIVDASEIVQELSRKQFITATFIKTLERFEDDRLVKHHSDEHHHNRHSNHHDHLIIHLPKPPLQSIESIVYVDADGNNQNLDLNDIQVDIISEPGRIKPANGKSWPSVKEGFNAVTITFKAGFGDDESSVPAKVKRAIKLLVSHYFENRDLVLTSGTDAEQIEFPKGLQTVIDQFSLPEFK